MSIDQLIGFKTTYTGLVRNVRAVERHKTDRSKTWMENIIDLEHHAQDGRPVMVEVKLSKVAMEAGVFAQIRPLINQIVSFDVYSQQRVWNGQIYTDYYYTHKNPPSVLSPSSSLPDGVSVSKKA